MQSERDKKWYEIVICSDCDVYEEISAFFAVDDIYDLVVEDSEDLSRLKDGEIFWDYADEDVLNIRKEKLYRAYAELTLEEFNFLVTKLKGYLTELKGIVSLRSVREIDPNEGLDEWKKYFTAFEVTDGVVICPSWEDSSKFSGKTVITMDPSGAFGTGTHETTRLCIQLLEKEIARRLQSSPKNKLKILDIGTGSGILSIYALLKGVDSACGVEADENALNIALSNVEKNGLKSSFSAQMADLDYGMDYDIVCANLIANIILDLKDRMLKAMKFGSSLILSGIIAGKEDEIEIEFQRMGFNIKSKLKENDWFAYLLNYEG